MDLVVADAARFSVHRTHPNRWLVAAASPDTARLAAANDELGPPPSALVARAGLSPVDFFALAFVELDRCGAWVTLTTGGGPRPLVVRAAGWTDLRGHPTGAGGDDRIGLGPRDSLVLFGGAGGDIVGDEIHDALLGVAGAPAESQLEAATAAGAQVVAVVAVPPSGPEDPTERVAAATGIPADELDLPGHPLGDAQPDLWKQPPPAPRLARLLVRPDVRNVRQVRSLLQRLLASWRIEDHVSTDDLMLLATELTANAVVHAGTDAYAAITYLGDRVRVAVEDASPALPRQVPPEEAGESGRGLHLVDAVAAAWGVTETAVGKAAWAEVPAVPRRPAER